MKRSPNAVAIANAVRDAGGFLICPGLPSAAQLEAWCLSEVQDQNRRSTYAPGCGQDTHVIGTNGGTMPCGGHLTVDGKTAPYFCGDCDSKISGGDQ